MDPGAVAPSAVLQLEELNVAFSELVVELLNARAFRKLDGSRRSAFDALDRPALKPLPARRFEAFQWIEARVNIDYHGWVVLRSALGLGGGAMATARLQLPL